MKDGQCVYTPREEQEQARLQGSRPATSTLHPLTTSLDEYQHSSLTSRSKQSQGGFTPRFVALDKKVLRYYGYFEDYVDPAVIGSAPLDRSARNAQALPLMEERLTIVVVTRAATRG